MSVLYSDSVIIKSLIIVQKAARMGEKENSFSSHALRRMSTAGTQPLPRRTY